MSNAKRRAGDAGEGRPGYKPESRVTPEESLQAAKERLEQINNGWDDELIAECEVLSRARDERLAALLGKSGGAPPKGSARTSVERQRTDICDDFDSARQRLHEALRKELEDIMRRAEAEIAAQAPDRQRARRKTRARGEGDEPARGPNAIAARLTDLKGRVSLAREAQEQDLERLRAKDSARPRPPAPAKAAAAGKSGGGKSGGDAARSSGGAKSSGAGKSGGGKSGGRAVEQAAKKGGSRSAGGEGGGKSGSKAAVEPAVHAYSSKGVLYVAGQRFERGWEVRVTQEAGATLEGVIASVTSSDVRLQLTAGKDSGRETRVQLQSLVTRKATIVKRSAAA